MSGGEDLDELAELRQRLEELEHRVARDQVGRPALAMAGNDVRIDCIQPECGGNLAILDAMTGTIRIGYDKLYAYLPAEHRCVISCKRCKSLVIVEHGQAVGRVDPLEVGRGWRAGEPLPEGLQVFGQA